MGAGCLDYDSGSGELALVLALALALAVIMILNCVHIKPDSDDESWMEWNGTVLIRF